MGKGRTSSQSTQEFHRDPQYRQSSSSSTFVFFSPLSNRNTQTHPPLATLMMLPALLLETVRRTTAENWKLLPKQPLSGETTMLWPLMTLRLNSSTFTDDNTLPSAQSYYPMEQQYTHPLWSVGLESSLIESSASGHTLTERLHLLPGLCS